MDKHLKYKFPPKSVLTKIDISNIKTPLPNLKNFDDSKANIIGKWLINWIKMSLSSGTIKEFDILPSKREFAYKLGVSIGTIQNALRYVEDLGYVESKQCIGTLVKNCNSTQQCYRKLNSKKDLAIDLIKNYIKNEGFSVGDVLPSQKTIATVIGFSDNTTRVALNSLELMGVIKAKYINNKEKRFIVKNLNYNIVTTIPTRKVVTLVDKVVKDLEDYISLNLNIGDRMPAHSILSEQVCASIKTVHDALKILIDKKILLAKRGRYGTTVIAKPNEKIRISKENSIFAPAEDAAFYHYEKIKKILEKMIASNYNVGDKLPTLAQLSKNLDVSPNTIRKAFSKLSKEGYLVFSRGRYGGTFVIDIPQIENSGYKWLAVNPEFAKDYRDNSLTN